MYEQLKAYNYLYTKEDRKQLTAQAIKAFRIQAKLQQKEVAGLLDINTQTYQGYENGRTEPPLEILVRLSFLYEVPVDILLQKDNFNKDINTANKILDDYNKQIEEMKEKLKTADPITRAQLQPVIEQLEEMTKAIQNQIK